MTTDGNHDQGYQRIVEQTEDNCVRGHVRLWGFMVS